MKIVSWKGKPIAELSREELIEALEQMADIVVSKTSTIEKLAEIVRRPENE